jgi:hypothetical protein
MRRIWDGQETVRARGDCRELRQVDVADDAREFGCASHSIDRRYGSDVLPLAPGIWRAEERPVERLRDLEQEKRPASQGGV